MKRIYGGIIIISCFILFFSCQKEYSLEQQATVGVAKGSLKDSLGNCLPDSVHGTFYNGVTPGGDTAFVEIQVNVDSTGNYRIYTDLQNGFMFADSGFFNATGTQTVRLKPIGTPILNISTNFTITFDTTACGFAVNVQDSTGTGLGGGNPGGGTDSTNLSDTAWRFTSDSLSFNGPFDSAFVGVDTTGSTYLALFGSTASTGDSLFTAFILLPNGVITPGTYNTNAGSAIIFSIGTTVIYQAHPLTANANTTITIISYDSTSKIVTGSFSGTAQDASGLPVNITNGTFKVKVIT
jgi:hypothetical protein